MQPKCHASLPLSPKDTPLLPQLSQLYLTVSPRKKDVGSGDCSRGGIVNDLPVVGIGRAHTAALGVRPMCHWHSAGLGSLNFKLPPSVLSQFRFLVPNSAHCEPVVFPGP